MSHSLVLQCRNAGIPTLENQTSPIDDVKLQEEQMMDFIFSIQGESGTETHTARLFLPLL